MDIKLLVIGNEITDKKVYYCGDLELEALRRYKELPEKLVKKIVKARVEMCKIMGVDFIKRYEIIERIK